MPGKRLGGHCRSYPATGAIAVTKGGLWFSPRQMAQASMWSRTWHLLTQKSRASGDARRSQSSASGAIASAVENQNVSFYRRQSTHTDPRAVAPAQLLSK